MVVAWLNAQSTQRVERLHGQSTIILEAIKAGSNDKVCQNLRFFVSLDLLDDPKQTIRQPCATAPAGVPSLPAAAQSSPIYELRGYVLDGKTNTPTASVNVSVSGVSEVVQNSPSGVWRLRIPSTLNRGASIQIVAEKPGYETMRVETIALESPIRVVMFPLTH